jgi:hypothetical protein
MMKAFVFARPSTPRLMGQEFGHVGWGLQIAGNKFYIGAVENTNGHPVTPPEKMDYWAEITNEPLGKFSLGPLGVATKYDLYKEISVETPDVDNAVKMMNHIKGKYYNVLSQNCMDSAYDILYAYGATNLPDPRSVENLAPIFWFNRIGVESQVLLASDQSIDIAVYENPCMESSVKRFIGNSAIKIPNIAREKLGFSISSIVVKRGTAKLYSQLNCQGTPLIVNSNSYMKHLDVMDNRIQSVEFLPQNALLTISTVKIVQRDITFDTMAYQETIAV